jgi:hypothetical protein
MANIVDINNNLSHKVSEVICIKCYHRWIAVRPVVTRLKDLACPNCNNSGYVIETEEDTEQDLNE